MSNSKAPVVIRRGKTGSLHRGFASQCGQSLRTHSHTHSDPQISTSFRIFNETRRRTPYYVLMMTKHTFNFLPHRVRPREETCVLVPERVGWGVGEVHRVEPLLSKLLWSRVLIWLKSSEYIFCPFAQKIFQDHFAVGERKQSETFNFVEFERDSFSSAPHKYCWGERQVGYTVDDCR